MDYAVLLYGDERRWDGADATEKAAAYADHREFARLTAMLSNGESVEIRPIVPATDQQ